LKKFIEIKVRMTPEKRETVKKHASSMKESTTAFINRAIDETMQRDTNGESKDTITNIANISDTNSHQENELSNKKKKATNEE